MATKQRIFIPNYISSVDYQPARVQPRILFYNGLKECEPYFIASGSALEREFDAFPYFDNYSGQVTDSGSLSLLFFNEEAPYGIAPTGSLYTQYWEDYVELLYNPRTRLLNASAIIPLADYFKMELNDIVQFRGNYYHLRYINDYNLKNGECQVQLLGPILPEALKLPKTLFPKCFGYDVSNCLDACYSVCECTPPCPPSQFLFSSVDDSAFKMEIYVTASNYTITLPINAAGSYNSSIYKTLFTASWGDGVETYVSGANVIGEAQATHTYTNPGTYEIALNGQIAVLGSSVGLSAQNSIRPVLTKIKNWGSIYSERLSIGFGCTKLIEIADGEPGLYSVDRWQSTFSGGGIPDTVITIPQNLLKYSINTDSVSAMFNNNRSVVSIPDRFFAGIPNCMTYNSTFSANSRLTSIGNNLFPQLPNKASAMQGIFRNARTLPTMPADLFNNVTGSVVNYVEAFDMSFTDNALTGSVYPIWTAPNFGAPGIGYQRMYQNCVSASNYASIPPGLL